MAGIVGVLLDGRMKDRARERPVDQFVAGQPGHVWYKYRVS